MLLTLLISVMLTQILNPLIADFENTISIEEGRIQKKITTQIPQKIDNDNMGPIITARGGVVLDRDSREILWSKNINNRYPIASISKLMSALVFLETDPDLEKTLTLSKDDMTNGGVTYIAEGEEVYTRDLLYAALIASDNNAAQALIRASGLSHYEFISRMNTKAKEIGMLNSRFIEPTGLEFENISSPQDVVLLLEAALENSVVADAMRRSRYEFESINGTIHNIENTNKLFNSYLEVIAGKTGFNNEALYNLTVAVHGPQNQIVLVAVLGSTSHDARFQDAKVLADWALNNYSWEDNEKRE